MRKDIVIKVKLITYYEDELISEEVISLKEFKDRFNTVRHKSLEGIDRIEFVIE